MKTITYNGVQENQNLYYVVSFDENEVYQFCQRLKTEACHTIHYDYVAIHGPYDRRIPMSVYDNNRYYAMSYTISNYKKSPAEKTKSQGIVNLAYRFEYDIHYYPYLLVLVENMISGDRNSFFVE